MCVEFSASLAVVWHFEHDSDVTRVSLRSNSDDVDVPTMARSMGRGERHRRASGFELKGCRLNSLVQQKGKSLVNFENRCLVNFANSVTCKATQH
jgi:hypothetical protein